MRLVLVILLLNTHILFACTCSLLRFDEAVKNADEIFIGKVYKIEFTYYQSIEYYEDTDGVLKPRPGDERSVRKVTFEIEKKWKGSNRKFVSVYDGISSCSFDFREFDRYLVYAYMSKLFPMGADDVFLGEPDITGFNTDFCSRTLPDPARYTWTENITTDPFNDIPNLNQRFPRLVTLIDFRILYGSIVSIILVGIFLALMYRRKVRLRTENEG